MEEKCIVSSCGKAASKCCGSCGMVRYCSIECQKDDWKQHHKKDECVNMKKLASLNLTEEEIVDVVNKISCICGRLEGIGEAMRSSDIYKYCLNFARDRLGRLDCDGSPSLMRDGVRLNHLTICRLLINLGLVYFGMACSSESDSYCISYLSEARELLVQRRDAGMNEPEMWELLMSCDREIYQLYVERGQLEKAKHHSVECVATARQCNVPDQVDYLIEALGMLSRCLRDECDFPGTLAIAEEEYLIASKHYSPAHKMVLQASNSLILCLIGMKDYSTADAYSRMNYANIMDPIHAGEYEIEDGFHVMNQLVMIWLEKEPDEDEIVEKALADEAIVLSRKVFAHITKNKIMYYTLNCLSTLCRVLLKGNELTEETEGLLHQLVTMCIAVNELNGIDTHDSFVLLHTFYSKIHESFPMGEESILVLKNIELCHKMVLELDSCNNGSVGYVKISQIIKPYFNNNVELHI